MRFSPQRTVLTPPICTRAGWRSARTGTPSCEGLAPWPRYQARDEQIGVFGETPAPNTIAHKEVFDLMGQVLNQAR